MNKRRWRRGRRRSAAGKRTRSASAAARRKDLPLSPAERRHLLQLMVCGGVFVLLVTAKCLLPEKMERVNSRLAGALERNMDVESVFHAVGRAFSGEVEGEKAAEEIYRAVFAQEEQPAKTAAVPKIEGGGAAELLRAAREKGGEPEDEMAEEEPVLYFGENLPEGVSMEQMILGFDYCPPLQEIRISSPFGYRAHPTEVEERFHYGIDLAAESGTAVRCFADGTVTAVGESSSYGNYCIVDHTGGFSTLYAHCRRIVAASGAEVGAGEIIAEVGETGMATGPHLHFELQRDGVYLNPVYYVAAL